MDDPLIPLANLNSRLIVWGPNGEELPLDDPEVERIGIQRCTGGCGKVKLLTAFDSGQAGHWCRECRNRYYRENYDNSPEARAQRASEHRDWTGKNRDHVRDYQRSDRIANPARYRRSKMRYSFHLSDVQLDAAMAVEVCVLCGKPCGTGRNLGVDHDHSCCPEKGKSCGKCVRGMLCGDCNPGLGWFHDDAVLLLKATAYVLWWRREHGKASARDLLLLKAIEGVLEDLGD